MHVEHGRSNQRDSLDEDVLRTIRLDELRPEKMSLAKDSLFHRHTSLTQPEQMITVSFLGWAGRAATRAPLPGPPMFAVGIAVDGSAPRYGDLLCLKGVDKRRKIHEFHALPTGQDQRIFRRIASKSNRRLGLDPEVDITSKPNSTGKELAFGYDHRTSSGLAASGNGFFKSCRAIGAIVPYGPKLGNDKAAVGKNRRLDALEDRRHLAPGVGGSRSLAVVESTPCCPSP